MFSVNNAKKVLWSHWIWCVVTYFSSWLTLCHDICTTPVVITVGVAVTDITTSLAGVLTDYSYINAPGNSNGVLIARCLTGLGPSGTSDGANGVLGGWYFNGIMIPNTGEQGPCVSDVIQVRPGALTAGISNIHQCETFSTSVEGIYTCTMRNSSMLNQSVRLGLYFNGRSESLICTSHHLICISHHLTIFHLSTQLLQW